MSFSSTRVTSTPHSTVETSQRLIQWVLADNLPQRHPVQHISERDYHPESRYAPRQLSRAARFAGTSPMTPQDQGSSAPVLPQHDLVSGRRCRPPGAPQPARAAPNGASTRDGLFDYLRRNRTTSTMITMTTIAPKPMNMGLLLSYLVSRWVS